jgi:alkanesulfonate monooxygenase SsuD/methylene tetrahydromethanopterin reductase-like flavin-dependent oxidoreductase (luciferase family)
MRYAFDVAPFGDLADPRTLVRLAERTEAAGWDGFSTWDTLGLAMDSVAADPFVALAGVAMATERIALLASVIVLPRRRPQLVAQAAATLDVLSRGRLVLGVGAGGDERDFTAFSEDWASSARVAQMDEAARIVDGFLRGETVTNEGPAYPVAGVGIGPRSAQQPRPPIWMGAFRPGGIRRAALWDGWIAVSVGGDANSLGMTPSDLAEKLAMAHTTRRDAGLGDAPFDVAVFGHAGLGGFTPADYEAVGATWWLESVTPQRGTPDDLEAIAAAGPPR